MAYFGWPRGHEDDGERAVWAALDIVAGAATPTWGNLESSMSLNGFSVSTQSTSASDMSGLNGLSRRRGR